MFVDSHCHLNFSELAERLPEVWQNMHNNRVSHALAISVSRETFVEVRQLAEEHTHIFASVGIHPDRQDAEEFSLQELIEHAQHPKVIGIGECGLDYHWCSGDLHWQHQRFITHIQAANHSQLPLIIHTRDAGTDTLRLLREQQAHGGVIHCFTEDTTFAKAVLDLGFYVSFSGIVTFKNAKAIQEACRYIPDDRLLIETDSPYLAPVPYRGKLNEPAYVKHTAEFIAQLRGQTTEHIGRISSENFFRLFHKATRQ